MERFGFFVVLDVGNKSESIKISTDHSQSNYRKSTENDENRNNEANDIRDHSLAIS